MTYEEAMETGKLVRLPHWRRDYSIRACADGKMLYSHGRCVGHLHEGASQADRGEKNNDWELWVED